MIYALDSNCSVIGMIDQYASAIWTVQFYGLGDFELVTYPKYLDLLLPGNLLVKEADRQGTKAKNVMIIDELTVTYDVENGNRVTVRGKSLKSILNKRIVWSQLNINDTVENAIRQVVTANAITCADERKLPIRLGSLNGFTDTIETQLFGENIGDWISSVCNQYGLGWDVILDDGMVLELYKTEEKNVVFSPKFGNLYSADLKFANEYTAALIGGEGEGTAQKTATIGTASGMDRNEVYIDGSGVSSNGEIITVATYIELLKQYGEEQLASMLSNTSCACEIDAYGIFKLGVDYFLGDKVKLEITGVNALAIITEIIYSEDEQGVKVLPTFSNWKI